MITRVSLLGWKHVLRPENGDESHTSGTDFPLKRLTKLKDIRGMRPDYASGVASEAKDHAEAIEMATELHG
ncbi:hypothetical protein Tco_0381663 [Tanacetum coccineum]